MRVQPKDVVTIHTWRAPKARKAIVVRTYKSPDDDTILALPSSSPLYESTHKAIINNTMDVLDMEAIYKESKTLHSSEFTLEG